YIATAAAESWGEPARDARGEAALGIEEEPASGAAFFSVREFVSEGDHGSILISEWQMRPCLRRRDSGWKVCVNTGAKPAAKHLGRSGSSDFPFPASGKFR